MRLQMHCALATALMSGMASATTVTVTVESLAPANGVFFTPVWVGFHNGNFDLYDLGMPASTGLERIAEDGDTAPLAAEFLASAAGLAEATITGPGLPGTPPVFPPGTSASVTFELDGSVPANRYFSYASMIIPSNDAFIANGNPLAHKIFDDDGTFLGAQFTVFGAQVNDAGTEINDELPANTAFFGQMTPDTGVRENGVVHVHPGFNAPGSGGILDDAMFANADFTAAGYQIARITVVPEPAALIGLALALGACVRPRRVRESD